MSKVNPVKRTKVEKPLFSNNLDFSDKPEEIEDMEDLAIFIGENGGAVSVSVGESEYLGCSIITMHDFDVPKVFTPGTNQAALVKFMAKTLDDYIRLLGQKETPKGPAARTVIATTISSQTLWERALTASKHFVAAKKFINRGTNSLVTLWVSNN